MKSHIPLALFSACALAGPSFAGIIYSSTDKDQWSSYINGTFTTIDFTETVGQIVKEQYAPLGVHFVDGNDWGITNSKFLDNCGINGNISGSGSPIVIEFDTPQMWVAANFLGSVTISLYSEDMFLAKKTSAPAGIGNKFVGVVSDAWFNKVVISDPDDGLPVIDDLHFGGPIPAPGVLAVFFGAVGLCTGRRRGMQ